MVGDFEKRPDTQLPPGFKIQPMDSDTVPSYRYSTVGPDPFQVMEDPAVGNEKQASPDGVAKSLSTQTTDAYQQGEEIQMMTMGTSVRNTDIEGQPAPHVYRY
jgi:hypothetical protein